MVPSRFIPSSVLQLTRDNGITSNDKIILSILISYANSNGVIKISNRTIASNFSNSYKLDKIRERLNRLERSGFIYIKNRNSKKRIICIRKNLLEYNPSKSLVINSEMMSRNISSGTKLVQTAMKAWDLLNLRTKSKRLGFKGKSAIFKNSQKMEKSKVSTPPIWNTKPPPFGIYIYKDIKKDYISYNLSKSINTFRKSTGVSDETPEVLGHGEGMDKENSSSKRNLLKASLRKGIARQISVKQKLKALPYKELEECVFNTITSIPRHRPGTKVYGKSTAMIKHLKAGTLYKIIDPISLHEALSYKNKIMTKKRINEVLHHKFCLEDRLELYNRLNMLYSPSHFPKNKSYLPKNFPDLFVSRSGFSYVVKVWLEKPENIRISQINKENHFSWEEELLNRFLVNCCYLDKDNAYIKSMCRRHFKSLFKKQRELDPVFEEHRIHFLFTPFNFLDNFIEFLIQEYGGMDGSPALLNPWGKAFKKWLRGHIGDPERPVDYNNIDPYHFDPKKKIEQFYEETSWDIQQWVKDMNEYNRRNRILH